MDRNGNIKDLIFKYLKEGMITKDSVAMAGIDESTLYRWINEDASLVRLCKYKLLYLEKSTQLLVRKPQIGEMVS